MADTEITDRSRRMHFIFNFLQIGQHSHGMQLSWQLLNRKIIDVHEIRRADDVKDEQDLEAYCDSYEYYLEDSLANEGLIYKIGDRHRDSGEEGEDPADGVIGERR